MEKVIPISGRVVAAGRVLAGISRQDFAEVAGISVARLRRLEGSGSAWVSSEEDTYALRRALDHFGVAAIDDTDRMGAGVRLKLTRQDVRQVTRLEDEGGIVGSDDAP